MRSASWTGRRAARSPRCSSTASSAGRRGGGAAPPPRAMASRLHVAEDLRARAPRDHRERGAVGASRARRLRLRPPPVPRPPPMTRVLPSRADSDVETSSSTVIRAFMRDKELGGGGGGGRIRRTERRDARRGVPGCRDADARSRRRSADDDATPCAHARAATYEATIGEQFSTESNSRSIARENIAEARRRPRRIGCRRRVLAAGAAFVLRGAAGTSRRTHQGESRGR